MTSEHLVSQECWHCCTAHCRGVCTQMPEWISSDCESRAWGSDEGVSSWLDFQPKLSSIGLPRGFALGKDQGSTALQQAQVEYCSVPKGSKRGADSSIGGPSSTSGEALGSTGCDCG